MSGINKGDQPEIPPVIEKSEKSPLSGEAGPPPNAELRSAAKFLG